VVSFWDRFPDERHHDLYRPLPFSRLLLNGKTTLFLMGVNTPSE